MNTDRTFERIEALFDIAMFKDIKVLIAYRLSLVGNDIVKNRALLLELMRAAYQSRST
jgi:hypothetical protein